MEKILSGLAKGKKPAFEKIFRLYYPRLIKYAHTFVLNRQEAEDLVQDVFFQVWENRTKFKHEKAISLGNLIGSNIVNIASVLGITAMIQPIEVKDLQVIDHDIFWMLAFAVVLLPLAFIPRHFEISRYKGVLIVLGYATFISLAFIN